MSKEVSAPTIEQVHATKPKHVVFVIHGINDHGAWGTTIEDAFKKKQSDIIIRPISYGYFPTWKFVALAPA